MYTVHTAGLGSASPSSATSASTWPAMLGLLTTSSSARRSASCLHLQHRVERTHCEVHARTGTPHQLASNLGKEHVRLSTDGIATSRHEQNTHTLTAKGLGHRTCPGMWLLSIHSCTACQRLQPLHSQTASPKCTHSHLLEWCHPATECPPCFLL